MIQELYSIKDVKAGSFMNIIMVPHIVEVTRGLTRMLSTKDNNLGLYPEDYALFLVGKFDQMSGNLVVQPKGPEFTQNLTAFLPSK